MFIKDFNDYECMYKRSEETDYNGNPIYYITVDGIEDGNVIIADVDEDNEGKVLDLYCFVETENLGVVHVLYPNIEDVTRYRGNEYTSVGGYFVSVIRCLKNTDSIINDVEERKNVIRYLMETLEAEFSICGTKRKFHTLHGDITSPDNDLQYWELFDVKYETLKDAVDKLRSDKIKRDTWDPILPKII